MRIGFDIDGTLFEVDIAKLVIIANLPKDQKFKIERLYYGNLKPLLDANMFLTENDELFIITSRPERLSNLTQKQIFKHYPNAKLFFCNNEPYEIGEQTVEEWFKHKNTMKAKMINSLKLDVYFDDDPDFTIDMMRKLCPKCKIIKWGGRVDG